MKKRLCHLGIFILMLMILLFACGASPKFRSGGFHSGKAFKGSVGSKAKSGLFHSNKSYKSSINKKNNAATKIKNKRTSGGSNAAQHIRTNFFPSGFNFHFLAFFPFKLVILIGIAVLIYLLFVKSKK